MIRSFFRNVPFERYRNNRIYRFIIDLDYHFYHLWNKPYHRLRRTYWFFYNFFYLLFEGLFRRTSGRRWFGLYCLMLRTFRRYDVYIEDEKHFPYDDWMIFPYWTRKAAEEDTKNTLTERSIKSGGYRVSRRSCREDRAKNPKGLLTFSKTFRTLYVSK